MKDMQSTTNYRLNKPESADIYNIEDFNENMDKIDAELKKSADHIADLNNPHNVTKEQLGLDEVDNTSDVDKPVSSAQQAAINNAKSNAIATAQTNTIGALVTPWSLRTWKKGELASNSGKVYRALQDNNGPYPWDLGVYWEEVTTSNVIFEHQQKLDVIGGLTTVNGSASVPPTTSTAIANFTLSAGIYIVISSASFADSSTADTIGHYRRIMLLQSAGTTSVANGVVSSQPPADGISNNLQICSVLNVTTEGTYYLNAQHDATESLSVSGMIRIIRIA